MSEKDFDLDFDFEKEYGFDTPEDTAAQQSGVDFDLKALLAGFLGGKAAAAPASTLAPETEEDRHSSPLQ